MSSHRSTLARSLVGVGDTRAARNVSDEEVDLARSWGAPRALGIALTTAGFVHAGRAGVPFCEEAIEVLRPSASRVRLGWAHVELGARLEELGRASAARERFGDALAIADSCGATALDQAARNGLRSTGARPRRGALTGPGALTPAERRVIELAASGRTNPEIAEHLFVGRKTVEFHLSNAYRKLGVSRREHLVEVLREGGPRGSLIEGH
jgi:DNA-binding CsgD family transcriptional regulator